MRYSAMSMRVLFFYLFVELMVTMMRYYCYGEVFEVMLFVFVVSNGLVFFV